MGTHPGAAPGAVVTLDKAKRLHQRATTPLKTNSTKDAKHTSASSASSQASDSASSASILPKKSSPSPSQEGQTPEAGQLAISTPSDAATARRQAIIMRAKMRSKSSKQKRRKFVHTVAKSKANSRNAKDDLRRQALINTTAPIAGGIDLRELRQRLETMKIASKSSAEKQGNITEDRSTAKTSNPESEKPLPDNQCTLADSINASHVILCTSSGQSQDSEEKKSVRDTLPAGLEDVEAEKAMRGSEDQEESGVNAQLKTNIQPHDETGLSPFSRSVIEWQEAADALINKEEATATDASTPQPSGFVETNETVALDTSVSQCPTTSVEMTAESSAPTSNARPIEFTATSPSIQAIPKAKACRILVPEDPVLLSSDPSVWRKWLDKNVYSASPLASPIAPLSQAAISISTPGGEGKNGASSLDSSSNTNENVLGTNSYGTTATSQRFADAAEVAVGAHGEPENMIAFSEKEDARLEAEAEAEEAALVEAVYNLARAPLFKNSLTDVQGTSRTTLMPFQTSSLSGTRSAFGPFKKTSVSREVTDPSMAATSETTRESERYHVSVKSSFTRDEMNEVAETIMEDVPSEPSTLAVEVTAQGWDSGEHYGWVQYWDTVEDAPYYYNVLSGESSTLEELAAGTGRVVPFDLSGLTEGTYRLSSLLIGPRKKLAKAGVNFGIRFN
eukprot:g3528.t1